MNTLIATPNKHPLEMQNGKSRTTKLCLWQYEFMRLYTAFYTFIHPEYMTKFTSETNNIHPDYIIFVALTNMDNAFRI